MSVITLAKNYQEAAEGLMRLVKNGRRQESQEGDAKIIEIVGDWMTLDADELDMWGGRLKFVFVDNEAKSREELVEREALVMQDPELAFIMSNTLLTVYRQQASTEGEEWEDVTREFMIKAGKYGFSRKMRNSATGGEH